MTLYIKHCRQLHDVGPQKRVGVCDITHLPKDHLHCGTVCQKFLNTPEVQAGQYWVPAYSDMLDT